MQLALKQIAEKMTRRRAAALMAGFVCAMAVGSLNGLVWGADAKAGKHAVAAAPVVPLIIVTPSKAYTLVPVKLAGYKLDTKLNRAVAANRDNLVATLGSNCGEPISFDVTVNADAMDRKIKFSGEISDYLGVSIEKVDGELAPKAGETQSKSFMFKPEEKNLGPFYFTGIWSDAGGEKGELYYAMGQPNRRVVLDDFESMAFPDAGGPFESSSLAAHSGKTGMIIRLPEAPAVPPGPTPKPGAAAAPVPPPVPQLRSYPMSIDLPGRPVNIGLWVKTPSSIEISIHLADPGFEAAQRKNPDTWTVGPVLVEAGDWKYVRIPMPDFGKSKARKNPYCDGDGVVDYPLTLQGIDFKGAGQTQICIDDLDVMTQGEPQDAINVQAVSDKPLGLLNRSDKFNLAVANTWLWGPAALDFAADLVDIRGRHFPLAKQVLTIAPGAVAMVPVALNNLPVGPYTLQTRLLRDAKPLPVSDRPQEYLVYEPGGKPLSATDLRALLINRNKLLVDLGFKQESVIFPWHSTDNSLAIEQFQGSWTFDWIAPRIKARQDAGLEVVGVLGFCPLWADPSTTYNVKMAAWYGSTYAMPSRTIYWEEYVHRTVEHFKDSISTWIVWDRPDSDAFKATPEEFADKMLQVAQAAAREVNPNAKIISGPVSRENIETYIQAMAEVGATDYLDGIGVYPTIAALSPEDGYLDVILARANRIRGREKIKAPIWIMNLGWATGDEQYRVSESEQALYVARAYAISRSQGIEHILLQPDRTEAIAKRDSADLIYPVGPLFGIKPAALSAKTAKAMLDGTSALREVFIDDRWEGLARAYLFSRPDGKLVLAAWRKEGSCVLLLPFAPESVTDIFGNAVTVESVNGMAAVTLRPDLQYIVFNAVQPDALVKGLERTPPIFDDAPESAWKRAFTFHLDVGDEADEKAVGYQCDGGKLVGPIDSYYNTEYGKHVIDSGRHFTGSESFKIDVSSYGGADMMLRKRINYSVPDQLVKVYCDDQLVGQWFAFKRDRRYRWRDIEFVVPSSFLVGKKTVTMKFVPAENTVATSYYYWAGPLNSKTIYVSDTALLVNTSGYGPEANRDKNILGGPIRFYKKPGETFAKGMGTNSAAQLPRSVLVLPLNKQFKRFKALVGVDSATNGQGSVRFRISDGKKTIWDSQDMTYYSDPKEVDLDVSDAIILMLWVGDADDGEKNDVANWANARLELK